MACILEQLSEPSYNPEQVLRFSQSLLVLKPLLVQWAFESWKKLRERSDLIGSAWLKSFNDLNPFDPKTQDEAMNRVLKNEITAYGFVPDQAEEEYNASYYNCETDSESDDDELDTMKRRVFGTRKSQRRKKQTIDRYGYQINSQLIDDGCNSDIELPEEA